MSKTKDAISCHEKVPPPIDTFNRVYWIVFLIGVICMMPWDMMTTLNGFWMYKFRNVTLDDIHYVALNSTNPGLTKRQKEFESYISIASSVPSAIVVVTHAFIGSRFSTHNKSLFSLLGLLITFSGVIVLAYLDSDDWATAFFISNLSLAVVINVFRALARATHSSNMGKFPVQYMGSLANGICMGGLIPVLLNLLILSMDVDIQMAGFYCFLLSSFIVLLVFGLYSYMRQTEFYQYYTAEDAKSECEVEAEKVKVTKEIMLKIVRNSWIYLLTIFLQISTTALIYPSSAALIRPVNPDNSDWCEVYFSQVTCFLTFNVCNYLGTVFAGLVQWPRGTSINSQVTILLLACLRIVLVPILMLTNLAPTSRHLPVVIESDVAFVCLFGLFSFSDGYVGNIAMMFAPKSGPPELQGVTAGVMVADCALSITVGSIFSNLIVKAL